MTKGEALKIIYKCAELYDQNLSNKNVLFICSSNSFRNVYSLETVFFPSNFMHMTGVKFLNRKRIPPNQFMKMCLDHRLSPTSFDMAPDGTTELKLNVLPFLVTKNLNANAIGILNEQRPVLYTDKIVGSSKGCVGFALDKETQFYAPKTILNEDVNGIIRSRTRIIATYQKKINDAQYTTCVYKAKKVDWSAVTYPAKYQYLSVREQIAPVA